MSLKTADHSPHSVSKNTFTQTDQKVIIEKAIISKVTMTAFSPADIPASVNTLEELVVWSATILNELYPDSSVSESIGRSNRAVDCAPFYVDAANPPGWYTIGRFTLLMTATWRQSGKPWSQVQEIGQLAIPANYKVG